MRRPSVRLLPLLLAAVLGGCSDASAPRVEPPAYDPTQLTGGLLYRWPTGATIAVYVDPTAVAPGVDLAGSAAAAMTAWKAALGGNQFSFRTAVSAADADITIHVSGAPRLVGFAGCAAPPDVAGGVTFFCPARDSALTLPLLAGPGTGRVKIDIAINPSATNAANTLRALVTHELGHAIGIGGHSTDPADVMHAQPSVATPSQRDIVTLRWVVRQPIDVRL